MTGDAFDSLGRRVRRCSTADGVTLVNQEFGVFQHLGMTIGFDGKLHGKGSD
jgi:hypothetical protein